MAQEAIETPKRWAKEEPKSGSGNNNKAGQSMMKLEIEKYSAQLAEGINLKKTLNQLNCEKSYQTFQHVESMS